MIEEIKNEILEMNSGILKDIVLTKEVFEILDKYDNKPDYKSAWKELKEKYIEYIDEYYNLFEDIEELEQKYNLGGE